MTSSDDLRVVELLCARLCHDLAGPIAGAAAGVELLTDSDGPAAEDVELLAASVSAAAAHLKFLRAALGHGTTPMAVAEMRDLAQGFVPAGGPIALEWIEEGHGDWPRPWAKLALNLVMVGRDALTRGGRLTLSLRPQPPRIRLAAEGPALAAEELLAPLHHGDVVALTPRSAQIHYVGRLAEEVGAILSTERDTTGLHLMVEAGPASAP